MDCRLRLSLVVGLIVGVGGCSRNLPLVNPSSPPPHKSADEDITHKASTYTAFAEMQAKSAESPQHAEPQKQQFRERARLSYLKALEIDPGYLPALAGLAQVQLAANDLAGAVAVYQKALEAHPREGQLWFELGVCHCRAKDWPAAISSFGKALDVEPNNTHYAKTAGLTLARAGQWDDAYVMLARVDGEAKAHYNLARMLKHTNQPELARRHASAALAVDPSFEAARTFLLDLEQGGAKPAQPAQTPDRSVAGSPRPVTTAHSVAKPDALPQIIQTGGSLPDAPMIQEGGTDKPVRVPPLPVIKLPTQGK